MSRRLRVAVIAGGWPGDSSHMAAAAREVNLVYHYSPWLPNAGSTEVPSSTGVPARAYTPLVKSPRGHLTFLFPGLGRALDTQQPDVVHVVSEPWGLLCAQAARWVRKNPGSTLAFHGCDTLWHHGGSVEKLARRGLLRYTLPVAHAYCAENGKALDLARENGLRPSAITERIHTCPRDTAAWRPPKSAERDRARAALDLDEGTMAVGLVGRLVPEKGIRTFLDAADILVARGLPARFFVVGDGPMRDELGRRRSRHIVPMGTLPHPDGVLPFMHALDVLACPSRSTTFWEDQGPRAVLEAMMCGCVPVATKTGGIPEMLGGHGVLSRSVEASEFADALAEGALMAKRTEARLEIAEWARSQYSNTAVAGRLVDLWTRLAAKCPSSPEISAGTTPDERDG